MIDISPFTDEQWWAMCDRNMSLPVPLSEADTDQPFVYDRTWGLFYVPMGYHQQAMALLEAFHHDFVCSIDYARSIGLQGYYQIETLADQFLLNNPGTCLASSVASALTVGRRSHLDYMERHAFRDFNIRYIEEN